MTGWAADIICNNCFAPIDLNVSNISATSALIDWDINGQSAVTSYILEYAVLGSSNFQQINNISATSFELTNLDPSTTYEVRVAAVCNGNQSSFTPSIDFMTSQSLACGATFHDSGGPNGNYSNNEFETYLICPDESFEVVTLQFLSFSLESFYDVLRIYDSDEVNSSALIGTYSGSNSPGIVTATNPTGCLSLTFDTDGSGFITLDELRGVLSGCESEAWERVIKEVDENGDGAIDLKEFIDLMTLHF